MQFQAAYILDTIAKSINDFRTKLQPPETADKINGLLQYVSCFEVEFPYTHLLDYEQLKPVLATLNNIITRGLPTRAPLMLEELFAQIPDLTERNKDEFEWNFPTEDNLVRYESIFELLHIIEPNLPIDRTNYGGNVGSNLEWQFIQNHPFLAQILESQRDFSSITAMLGGGRTVDFCFTSPYLHWDKANKCYEKVGRIFEVDGAHHSHSSYRYYDAYRDAIAAGEHFETIRFSTETIQEDKIDVEVLIGREIYQTFKKNYEKDITKYRRDYSLLFIPISVARIQKTLIEYFLFHPDIFKKEKIKIKIAIIERDLPCGAIAIKSLQALFLHINAILEDEDKLLLPEIELTIFENKKWVVDAELHLKANIQDEAFFKQNEFDIIIDHAVLRRSNIYQEKDFQFHKDKTLKIRSSHYVDTSFGKSRRVYCAKLLHYKTLVTKKDDGSYDAIETLEAHINFFINNIFRKTAYREGQLPIISRALQQKPVIGLLPTGGGKSLTFQLPAFLQPGLCLVVDPIKSLMEDQVRVLKESWIDCCDFINSNLERKEKAKKLIDFRYGETMFLFISPERFVMEEFRNIIRTIDLSPFGLAFSYCVIDEVHCVSEWGHDFRSTYLMLGKNAQKFAKTKTEKAVSLIGLTATASFDVLADIEREVQIQHDDVANAIIMIENTIRPELFFRVIEVTDKDRIRALNEDFCKMGTNLQQLNNEEIILQSLAHHYIEFENIGDYGVLNKAEKRYDLTPKGKTELSPKLAKLTFTEKLSEINVNDLYSIIFCPTKGNKRNTAGALTDTKGVPYVYENLVSTSEGKGFFYASETEETSKEVQAHFKSFTADNGKIKHIVCTKAFGMGIDKKNIRATYHYFYSGSLESLVQEAGRSGRDKKISEATILLSKKEVFILSFECLLKESPENSLIKPLNNIFYRLQIRHLCQQEYYTEQELKIAFSNVINIFPMSLAEKTGIHERCLPFIQANYEDRKIQDFFYQGAFKGVDTEVSQFYSLFKDKEFVITSKLKELKEEYNIGNATDFVFKYWAKGVRKRLYIETYQEEKVGFIDLSLPLHLPLDNVLKSILAFLKSKNSGQDDIFNLVCSEKIDDDLNEGTLEEVFNACQDKTFPFYLACEKIFPDNFKAIYLKISEKEEQVAIQNRYLNELNTLFSTAKHFGDILNNIGNQSLKIGSWFILHEKYDTEAIEKLKFAFEESRAAKPFLVLMYEIQIEKSFKQSKGSFLNFLLLLEENIANLTFTFDKDNKNEKWLKLYYNRSRHFKPTNDTGRLIYRMHSMGFLEDYVIDYNKNNLYTCTFRKYASIEDYTQIIEKYLRRYLSENSAKENIERLEKKLTKATLIEKIVECLYFLSEFSYKEIASKRKRATDEIETMLNASITNEEYVNDLYQQNIFIKEQIYFYFNAKYARIGFKINVAGESKDFSLLDDYNKNILTKKDSSTKEILLTKEDLLTKYLGVLSLEGTAQNNYKHMIGSCKKILRSLGGTDLEKEWVLRLLKAFAMYSVNNASYISEANEELEKGFENLYKDKDFHQNSFEMMKPIFDTYFEQLLTNIDKNNSSFNDIKLIRLKLLLNMQTVELNNFLNNFNA